MRLVPALGCPTSTSIESTLHALYPFFGGSTSKPRGVLESRRSRYAVWICQTIHATNVHDGDEQRGSVEEVKFRKNAPAGKVAG